MIPNNMIYFDPSPKETDYFGRRSKKPNLFMKYFPKYLKNLTINSKNGAVKSKLKRTKVIHDLKDTEFSTEGSHWRVLLSNKMKSVKTLSYSSQSSTQFVEKIKLFSGLQSVRLAPLGCEHWLSRKENKKMLGLPKLRSLQMDLNAELTSFDSSLLRNLSSLPKLLKPLQALTIFYAEEEQEFPTFVKILKDNQNILRYMTSFSAGRLFAPDQHQALKNLEESCPNLRHLSFEFSCREMCYDLDSGMTFSKTRLPAHANCLGVIKTFPNLKSLDLKILDNEAFLTHFALPPGVQSLLLEFEENLTAEILQKICGTRLPEKFFEENPTLVKLFENFERLENLVTFKLTFSKESCPESYFYQNQLSKCLLKRLPFLKNFAFVLKGRFKGPNEKPYQASIEDVNLPQLLEACHENVETLKIATYEKILYSEYDFSAVQNKFANLKTIQLNGIFRDNVKSMSSLFYQLVSLGNSITTLEFTAFFENEEFFIGLFDELGKLQIPKKLKLQMKIKPSKNYEYWREKLPNERKPEQKVGQRLQGISIDIFTPVKSWYMVEFLKSSAERFDNFRIIYKSRGWNHLEWRIWP